MHEDAQAATHEPERISRRPIVLSALWALVLAAVLSAVSVGVWFVRMQSFESAAHAASPARPAAVVSSIRGDLFGREGAGQALRARQREKLERFGWVDRSRGLVHIPIDEAIELELSEEAR